MSNESHKNSEAGFTLIELMISMALLLVIAGASIGAMNSSQKGYRQSEIERALHQQMRGAIEQMAQEITQAGLVSTGMEMVSGVATSAPITLPTGWSIGSGPTITVSSVAGLFAYENLWVDTGALTEPVTILSINSATKTITLWDGPTTAPLSQAHAAGAVVIPRGVFAAGILPPNTLNGSTPTSLRMFGDINNDGSLDYVRYDCPAAGTTGPLVRSAWDLRGTPPAWTSQRVPLLDNVTSCLFVYTYTFNATRNPVVPWVDPSSDIQINAPDDPSGTNVSTSSRFTLSDNATFPQFVLAVGITVTSCSQTGVEPWNYTSGVVAMQPVCLTKSFLNIQPRNVLAGYMQTVQAKNIPGSDGLLLYLQPTPTALLPTTAP
jgi:prepilin-type N-terminal cleavage/methylation domain-containing protein